MRGDRVVGATRRRYLSVAVIKVIQTPCHHLGGMGRPCEDCGVEINKAGHRVCYACFKKRQKRPVEGNVEHSGNARKAHKGAEYKFKSSGGAPVTATGIATHFKEASQGSDVTAQKVNRVLESLGWITRSPYATGGWNSTPAGRRFGASDHIAQSGAPYVKFEAPVVHQPALVRAFSELAPAQTTTAKANAQHAPVASSDCKCFCGKCSIIGKSQKYKTRDGHYVRSRGEVMIDNYLYSARVPHAYELEVHLPESDKVMVPDFVVLTPKGNVYVEFWSMEGQSDYDTNTDQKKKLYEEFDLELIDVWPANLDDLDAYLSRKLAQYGVRTAF